MACLTATVVGAITVGIILFELINERWNTVLYHGGLGVVATIFFWLLCIVLGDQISFGIFIIPAIVFFTFLVSSWLFTKQLRDRGCCVKCKDNGTKPEPQPIPGPDEENCEPIRLNATPVLPS